RLSAANGILHQSSEPNRTRVGRGRTKQSHPSRPGHRTNTRDLTMATDYILEIEGIKGESTDSKVQGGIELQSYGWGVRNPASRSAGPGGGAGTASFADFAATAAVNKASPLLMLACATGQHIKKAVLHVRKQGGEQQEYMTITMTELLVSSYNSGDAPGGDVAVIDSFSLNYTTITFHYKPHTPDGSLDSAGTAGGDPKQNNKM